MVNQQEDKLDSWQEIADHLKRQVRTVSRWERERGLPVHRVPGGKRGAVYAYRSEVDAWLRTTAGLPVAESPPVGPNSSTLWRAAGIWLAGLGIVILGLLFALRLARSPNPQQATLVGAELTALDGAGRAIWRYRFPEPVQPTDVPMFDPNQNTQIHLEDLNGDGKNEVLVAAAYNRHSETNHDELYCFASGGRLLWRYQPHAEFNFVGRKASGPWKLHSLTVVPEDGKKVVWAAFTDPVFAPAIVASIDADGRSGIRYISSGNVNALIGLANKKGTFILAGGVNNEYRAASLAVLSSRQPQAASPQTPGNRFQCTTCPSGRPLLFVVLPRSEVNVGSGKPYNWVNFLERRAGGILVSVLELEEPGVDVRQYFELSDDLTPKNASFGAGYREAHERLEKRGLIAHKWADCQEQKHPAIARAWDEARGWREIQIPWVH